MKPKFLSLKNTTQQCLTMNNEFKRKQRILYRIIYNLFLMTTQNIKRRFKECNDKTTH